MFGYPCSSKYLILYKERKKERKKLINTGLGQHVSKYNDRNTILGRTIPLIIACLVLSLKDLRASDGRGYSLL